MTSERADTFALRAGLVAALALFAATELLFRHGFDFTDEGAYLLGMDRPWEYTTLHQLASFVFRPLYLLLGGSVFLLRAVWFAVMFAAAAMLCRSFVAAVWTPYGRPPRPALRTLPFALAAAGTGCFLNIWLPTPNYNSLNFFGICLFATGFLDLHSSGSSLPRNGQDGIPVPASPSPLPGTPSAPGTLLAPRLLMAAGVWFSFMGRAYTAPALMFLALLAALRAKDVRPLLLPALVAAGLLLLTSFWTDGSPQALLERFLAASRERHEFGSHNWLNVVNLEPAWTLRYLGGPFTPVFLGFLLWGFALGPDRKGGTLGGPVALAVPPLALVCLIFTDFPFGYYGWAKTVSGHNLWAVPCGAYLRTLATGRTGGTGEAGGPTPASGPGLLVPLGLMYMALAFTFGSNNPLLVVTSLSALFIALGFCALLAGRVSGTALPGLMARLAWSGVLIGCGAVYCSAGHPYRQDAELWNQRTPASIPAGGGEVYLSERRARYVAGLQAQANASGFRPGGILIDLSGQQPGSSYAVGGFMPKSLWITSGYPGSRTWISTGLDKLSCSEIARSWLLVDLMPLTEPLDPRFLLGHGAKVPEDYEPAAKALFPVPVGPGYLFLEDHRLLKPRRSQEEAEAACRLA
ncbi:MAG: hypothetical protein LBQ79_11895, partial [Deltaproteobacteria bacterium]|nr:hypothetical protein [Deltaproteobacteria bacterium]